MKPQTLVLVAFALMAIVTVRAEPITESSRAGRVCLAPLPIPAKGQSAPWKRIDGSDLTNYSVRINQESSITLSFGKAQWVSGLSLTDEHSVLIRVDGEAVDSFKFKFAEAAFEDATRPDLCLFLGSLYFTWQLWPVERTGDWCPCWANDQ